MDSSTDVGARELEAVRQRRAELGETLALLRQALERDADLRAPIDRLTREFALHVEVTEGPGGLHEAILAGDLRLANQVNTLAAEHRTIAAELAAVAVGPGSEAAADVLAHLVRHRQRGADLIHEAYETDLGGGD